MDHKVSCWKCSKVLSEIPIKVGFRAACPYCHSDQHVCKNCRYYAIGKPNDCLVPGTEPIRDRESSNLCEEFKLRILSEIPSTSSERARRILGEPEKKRDFKSLFKDDEL